MFKPSAICSALILFTSSQVTAQGEGLSRESQMLLDQLANKIALTTSKIVEIHASSGSEISSFSAASPEFTVMPLGVMLDSSEFKVSAVDVGSIAHRVGIEINDVLLMINGRSLNDHSASDVLSSLSSLESGEPINLKVQRKGEILNLQGEAKEMAIPSYTLELKPSQDKEGKVHVNPENALIALLKKAKVDRWTHYRFRFYPIQKLEPCISTECKKIFKEYEKYSRKGDSRADLRLGEFYYFGYGVDKNKEQALKKFKEVGNGWRSHGWNEVNSGHAAYMTSVIHRENNDVEKAEKYLKIAARHESVQGMYELGLSYLVGDWLEYDIQLADKWLSKTYKYAPNKIITLSEKLESNYLGVLAKLETLQNAMKTQPSKYQLDGDGTSAIVREILALYPPEDIFNAELQEQVRTRRLDKQLTINDTN